MTSVVLSSEHKRLMASIFSYPRIAKNPVAALAEEMVFFSGRSTISNWRHSDVQALVRDTFVPMAASPSYPDEADVLASAPDPTTGLRRFRLGPLEFSCDRATVTVTAFDGPGSGIQRPVFEFLSAVVGWLAEHHAATNVQAGQVGVCPAKRHDAVAQPDLVTRDSAPGEAATIHSRSVSALGIALLLDWHSESGPALQPRGQTGSTVHRRDSRKALGPMSPQEI